MRLRPNAAKVCAAAIVCYSIANFTLPCYALLIDDFSVDQVGISTNQNAAYDFVEAPEIFSGTRVIWGGGASIPGACQNCDIATTVTGGQMTITPGADCPGTGNVSWHAAQSTNPVATYALSADLSNYVGLEIHISELTGTAWTRISIASGGNSGAVRSSWDRLDVFFSSVGPHVIPFSALHHSEGPKPLNLHDINNITIATYLDVGEFVAFDSVSLVPEPAIFSLVAVSLFMLLPIRRRRNKGVRRSMWS